LRKVKYGDFDIKAVSLVSPAGILISFTWQKDKKNIWYCLWNINELGI
jgi:hypothetical protein